jgi:hypothetical protein
MVMQPSQVAPRNSRRHAMLVFAKQVSDVVIGAETIEGDLKSPIPSGKRQFATIRIDPAIAEKLDAASVPPESCSIANCAP